MMPTASAPVSAAAAARSYRAGRLGVAVVLEVASVEVEVVRTCPQPRRSGGQRTPSGSAAHYMVQDRTVAWVVQAGSLAVVVPTPDPG